MSTSANPAAQPAFGLKLPARYSIRRHIASGGMASVWCAEDRVLGRPVAIKVLSERFAHDDLAIRRFKREARTAARVSAHPHVVTIFDVGDIEPDGRPGELSPRAFIVMEHLAGGTVADALRCDSVTRAEARRWLREAASGLDHAHERGIVHRDIKPANFLLDRERGLHVADFGIARLQSEDTITSSGELFGTAAYLAPEQALGHDATGASDRYALAVAAFELLTGGRPFSASHFAAQARQHIEEEPPSASERDHTLPPAVDDVLRRGMAKEPAARYPTAGAFVDALEAALDGGGRTTATRPLVDDLTAATWRQPNGRRRAAAGAARRRHNRAPALAALAVVALGVILLISQLGGSSPPRAQLSSTHQGAPATGRSHSRRTVTHIPRASTSASTSASSTSTASASSTAAPATSASALQLQGHQQLASGNYAAAIATLHRALAAASPASLTYAYALYDLGDSLLRSGNAKAAVAVLQQRLKIPNQTPVVQQLLNQALRVAGMAPAPHPGSGGAGVPPGQAKHGKDKGKGGGGPGGGGG